MPRRQALVPLAILAFSAVAGPFDRLSPGQSKPPAAGVAELPMLFKVQPGVREFSGRVIARPMQIMDWRARGLTDAQAIARRASAVARVQAQTARRFDEVDELLLDTPAGMTDAAFAAQLLATGDYQYVEPDWIVHAVAIPNDPQYPQQWHLPKINAPTAWNTTTGAAGVVIAICDSGIDLDHPDLAGALVSGYNAVDQLAQSAGGQVDGLTNHGTQVAGSCGAMGNNLTGVCGVGWNLRLMPVRVSNQANDTASISVINAGARWAVDHGARIVNASFSQVQTAAVQTTGAYIRNAGGIYVWAAGNASASLGTFDHADVVIVGATDQNDAKAAFSNFGRCIDVVAPGVDIVTTNLGSYGPISGTSFASPITCGVLGLIWSANPGLSSRAAEAILESTASDLGVAGEDDVFGSGRFDAAAAVQLAVAAATTPLPPIARDDQVTSLNAMPFTINVLGNDVDLNGQAIDITGFPSVTGAAATLTLISTGDPGAPHAISYQPPVSFEGIDTFTYAVSDTTALSDTASVQVGVAHAVPFGPPISIDVTSGFGSPTSIERIDLDNDGDLDLVGNYVDTLATVRTYRNDGTGAFNHIGGFPLSSFSKIAVGFGEFTGDSCPDIVFVEQLANRLGVAAGNCNLGFAAPVITTLSSANTIVASTVAGQPLDFNNDGKRDIVVGQNGFPSFVRVMLGQGNGTFVSGGALQVSDPPGSLAAGDLTGDGFPEIICAGGGAGTITVIRITNTGQILSLVGTVTAAPVAEVSLVDVEGDHDLDVAFVVSGSLGDIPGVRVMRNNGAGALGSVELINATGEFPGALAVGDLDADGDVDFVTANLLSNTLSVYPGIAGGQLLGVASLLNTSTGPVDVTVGDFDGDHDLDLAAALVSVPSQRILLFKNLANPFIPGPGDVNADGVVNVADLLMVISHWGACPALPATCAGDANTDGAVNVADLLLVIVNWG